MAAAIPPTEDIVLPDDGDSAEPVLLVATDGRIATHTLAGRSSFVIGRSPEADIVVNEPWVSRRHARLELGPPHRLTDLGSANGTRHRGRILAAEETVELAAGEVVELGRTLVLLPRADAEPLPAVAGASAMDTARALVARLAATDISLLFLGETGVGKQVLAERAHRASRRAAGPLVAVNAANLVDERAWTELFGAAGRPGLLELARGGTFFLDEVAELAAPTQAKLLHVLEGKPALDVRFMSATNRNLRAEVEAGRFRSDLFFRLNGIAIYVPPLRERRHELRALAQEILAAHGGPSVAFADDALAVLDRHDWPGNVRELRQAVERALALREGNLVTAADLCVELSETTRSDLSLRAEVGELEEARIRRALEACGGNQSAAAKILGMSRNTLIARIRSYGLPRPQRRD